MLCVQRLIYIKKLSYFSQIQKVLENRLLFKKPLKPVSKYFIYIMAKLKRNAAKKLQPWAIYIEWGPCNCRELQRTIVVQPRPKRTNFYLIEFLSTSMPRTNNLPSPSPKNGSDVRAFLAECGLSQYYDKLMVEGFDRISTVRAFRELPFHMFHCSRNPNR
jgi:hypothetical protein